MKIHRFLRTMYAAAEANPDGCWIWPLQKDKRGYGRVELLTSGIVLVHRLAFSIFERAPREGEYICHHCDNPPCFRPDHLFAGTPTDNARDREAKGRGKSSHAHCGNGHLYHENDNLVWVVVKGVRCRACRTCRRLRCREREERQRALRA